MGRQVAVAVSVLAIAFFFLAMVTMVSCTSLRAGGAQKLNIHIIPHTHDDVGWLKTVDEYYMGANNSIQEAGVQYILDSIMPALLENPERRFVYVEIAFFERWWNEQDEPMKQIVRRLVAEGRLEFINGGWCMNDEATTHYEAIIDQMTQGHDFLYREFGIRPTIGWHIDPFGHAATMPSLMAQMGFNAWFFWRIDYEDREVRLKSSQMEFIWRGSQSLGKQTEIFTGIFHDSYTPPPGFCFECGDPPIQNDPRIFNVNIKDRADSLVQIAKDWSGSYRTPNILITFGSDFQYSNANVNFKNMDKLIAYIRDHPEYYGDVNIFYSTPSMYVDHVHKYSEQTGMTWDVKTDDFFPYAMWAYGYWSGYFSSRPALKGYVRSRANVLHTTEKLHVTASGVLSNKINTPDNLAKIDALSRAFSVAQHHDAVSGTEKQHVADDYAERMSIGTAAAESLITDLVGQLLTSKNVAETAAAALPSFDYCHHLNVSICQPLEVLTVPSAVVPVVVVNPLGWNRTEYFRLPVPVKNVKVMTANGVRVPSETFPNADRQGMWTLVFAISVPAMGFTSFTLQRSSSEDGHHQQLKHMAPQEGMSLLPIENEYYRVVFDTQTGHLVSIRNKLTNQLLPITQDLLWYNASTGNNVNSSQVSGAYIFRPNSTQPMNMTSNNYVSQLTFLNGSLVQEVRQVWNSWAYQTVRLYQGANHIELEHTIGPIDISDGLGKEVITRYNSALKTNGMWYTDSEGQEMQFRKRNFRPTYNVNITDAVAGNYFPVNTAAYIKDISADAQLTLLTDRSEGCSSQIDGGLELMLHRRLLRDDGLGVGEALNESTMIRVNHRVIVDRPANSSRKQRSNTLLLNNPSTLLFGLGWQGNSDQWFSSFSTKFTPLVASLPPNVHLMTLKAIPESDNDVLLRLNHIYAVGEDNQYSQPVTVDVGQLFNDLKATSMVEMTLTANRPRSELKRLQWKTASLSEEEEEKEEKEVQPHYEPVQGTVVVLKPMEIRTFIVTLAQA